MGFEPAEPRLCYKKAELQHWLSRTNYFRVNGIVSTAKKYKIRAKLTRNETVETSGDLSFEFQTLNWVAVSGFVLLWDGFTVVVPGRRTTPRKGANRKSS